MNTTPLCCLFSAIYMEEEAYKYYAAPDMLIETTKKSAEYLRGHIVEEMRQRHYKRTVSKEEKNSAVFSPYLWYAILNLYKSIDKKQRQERENLVSALYAQAWAELCTVAEAKGLKADALDLYRDLSESYTHILTDEEKEMVRKAIDLFTNEESK